MLLPAGCYHTDNGVRQLSVDNAGFQFYVRKCHMSLTHLSGAVTSVLTLTLTLRSPMHFERLMQSSWVG